jgi:GTP-binding protein YchF
MEAKAMQIGIVGLPNSSKTTVFNALTRSQVETASFSTGQVETNTAVVEVPDLRIVQLSDMFRPEKTTFARIQYNDIAGLRSGISQEGALSGALLNAIAQNDALLHVVRGFEDERIAHPAGSVDPLRDLAALDFEFLFSDLSIVERRMERLAHDLSRARPGRDSEAERDEFDLMMRLRENLEQEIPLRDVPLTDREDVQIRGYQFLTAKPMLVVVNVGDDGDDDPGTYPYPHRRAAVVCLRGGLEMELAQMDAEEAQEFLSEYGIGEPGLNRMIRQSYDLLGLHSFFTVGEDEVRAWTIPQGATAVEAAAAIHSDLSRGFIRAEVVAYDDLVAAGSLAGARRAGVLRLEGRNYVVHDGDVMNILFNV